MAPFLVPRPLFPRVGDYDWFVTLGSDRRGLGVGVGSSAVSFYKHSIGGNRKNDYGDICNDPGDGGHG